MAWMKCEKCDKVLMDGESHYDPKLRGFTCLVDHDGKLRVKYDKNGNEEV